MSKFSRGFARGMAQAAKPNLTSNMKGALKSALKEAQTQMGSLDTSEMKETIRQSFNMAKGSLNTALSGMDLKSALTEQLTELKKYSNMQGLMKQLNLGDILNDMDASLNAMDASDAIDLDLGHVVEDAKKKAHADVLKELGYKVDASIPDIPEAPGRLPLLPAIDKLKEFRQTINSLQASLPSDAFGKLNMDIPELKAIAVDLDLSVIDSAMAKVKDLNLDEVIPDV